MLKKVAKEGYEDIFANVTEKRNNIEKVATAEMEKKIQEIIEQAQKKLEEDCKTIDSIIALVSVDVEVEEDHAECEVGEVNTVEEETPVQEEPVVEEVKPEEPACCVAEEPVEQQPQPQQTYYTGYYNN